MSFRTICGVSAFRDPGGRLVKSLQSIQPAPRRAERGASKRALPHMSAHLVHAGSFLTLHYRLAAADGSDLINTFDDKPATLSLGTGELAPAMEARLIGLAEGSRDAFELAPGEAFGERNPELLQRVRLALLREHGDAEAENAVGDAGVVQEVGADSLLVDFNHPLAGRPLRFEVHLIGVL
jgi:FKBP-type peptidyl-prolyl cis-trans isomerase SlpA